MKLILAALLSLSFYGCSTMNKDLTEKHVGKIGFLKVRPKVYSMPKYNPCVEVKIVSVFSDNFKFTQDGVLFISAIDDTFKVEDLEIEKSLPKYKKGGVCENTFYQGMSRSEFLALRGRPDAINSTNDLDQYVYNHGLTSPSYFYFSKSVLKNWQVTNIKQN